MHKVAARHLAAIESGAVTRSNIIGMRNLFNASSRDLRGWSVGKCCPVAPWGECVALMNAIEKRQPEAVGELAAGGFKVLRNPRHKRRLERVAAILPDVVGIRLIRWEDVGTGSPAFVPVWRAKTADARAFDFRNIPWQSGGDGPEIFNVNMAGGTAHA